MACISKLASAIAYDCDTGAAGLASAIIINKADIESFSVSSSTVHTLTLSAGATGFKIDTPKRVLVLSEALKVNDGAPNAFTHSATLTITPSLVGGSRPPLHDLIINPLANGSFVILAKLISGNPMAFGLYYGMSATSLDRSTHDNANWATVTMATPENVIGEDALHVVSSLYEELYAAAV